MKTFISWFIYAVICSQIGIHWNWYTLDKNTVAFYLSIAWILSFSTMIWQSCFITSSSTFKAFNTGDYDA